MHMGLTARKVYRITFLQYEDKDQTVVNFDGLLLRLVNGSALIFEEDVELMQDFGSGIRTLEYLGELLSLDICTETGED